MLFGNDNHLRADCPVPKALARWDDEYLAKNCADSPISVAVTPNGYAFLLTGTKKTIMTLIPAAPMRLLKAKMGDSTSQNLSWNK